MRGRGREEEEMYFVSSHLLRSTLFNKRMSPKTAIHLDFFPLNTHTFVNNINVNVGLLSSFRVSLCSPPSSAVPVTRCAAECRGDTPGWGTCAGQPPNRPPCTCGKEEGKERERRKRKKKEERERRKRKKKGKLRKYVGGVGIRGQLLKCGNQ